MKAGNIIDMADHRASRPVPSGSFRRRAGPATSRPIVVRAPRPGGAKHMVNAAGTVGSFVANLELKPVYPRVPLVCFVGAHDLLGTARKILGGG